MSFRGDVSCSSGGRFSRGGGWSSRGGGESSKGDGLSSSGSWRGGRSWRSGRSWRGGDYWKTAVTFGSLGFGLAAFLHEESITLLLLLNTITASRFAALLRFAFRDATVTRFSFAALLQDLAGTVLLATHAGATGFLARLFRLAI